MHSPLVPIFWNYFEKSEYCDIHPVSSSAMKKLLSSCWGLQVECLQLQPSTEIASDEIYPSHKVMPTSGSQPPMISQCGVIMTHLFAPYSPTTLLGQPNFRISHMVSRSLYWACSQLSFPFYANLLPSLPFHNIHSKNQLLQ